jgi:O-antigen/teichoic acid export membrane protein
MFMDEPSQTTAGSLLIAKNTALNLATQSFLALLALWSLPIVVKGLPNENFGLLSLVWAFIGYFTLLDFGLGRANTKFLAEAAARGNADEVRNIVWTSLSASFVVGVVSGSAIGFSTSFLVHNVFTIGPALTGEAERAFMTAAIGVPFMLVFGTLKGFQMALQRFGVFNLFQGLTGIFQWIGSVVLLWSGFGLEEIVLLTVGSRVALAFVAFLLLPQFIPRIFHRVHFWHGATFRRLISFGGWVTVSLVISPLFLYLDRVFLGMFLSLTAVAYYTVPQEVLTRVLVLPMSLTSALFPALSEQSAFLERENKTRLYYAKSVKYLASVMFPLFVGFLLFAGELIELWMGKAFAVETVLVFQILAIGLLFNSLAQIPTTALHALGRPDLTAKFHLIELPFMVILNLILIPLIGIIGAAITWTLRVAFDSGLLFAATWKQLKSLPTTHIPSERRAANLLQPIFWALSIVAVLFISDSTMKLAAAAILGVVYVYTTWLMSFDEIDRSFFLQLRTRMFQGR